MDLQTIETYLRPSDLQAVPSWEPGYAWLAGGTWLFSEPQPKLSTLIDLEPLGWSDITLVNDRLSIGATCTFQQLLSYPWLPEWRAIAALKDAIAALAASFKVTQLATIGGNLCLALAVGVMAPLMVLLDATYEIWSPAAAPRYIAAKDFQQGIQTTALRSGEVLRRIWIPQASLTWQTSVQRFGIAATDPALSLVMAARVGDSPAFRVSLGACVPAPVLLEFPTMPVPDHRLIGLEGVNWLTDARATAVYRQHVTQVLIQRALHTLGDRQE